MPDQPTREEFDRLRATVVAQQAHIARLERAYRRRRRPGRGLPLVFAALLLALVPASLLAANPFQDLTGGVHDANIDAIYQAGITTGCDPTHYCPRDFVTREQMASFLARTAGLGTNPPVANAAQLGGVPAAGYLRRGAADFAVLAVRQTPGPLPKSFAVTSHGGRLVLLVSGSAYGTATGAIGVAVTLDGSQVALLQVSVNETLSHKGFPAILATVAPAAGDHTVTFAVSGSSPATGTDIYDVFNLTVLELPLD
jgi:hypothetical protein